MIQYSENMWRRGIWQWAIRGWRNSIVREARPRMQ